MSLFEKEKCLREYRDGSDWIFDSELDRFSVVSCINPENDDYGKQIAIMTSDNCEDLMDAILFFNNAVAPVLAPFNRRVEKVKVCKEFLQHVAIDKAQLDARVMGSFARETLLSTSPGLLGIIQDTNCKEYRYMEINAEQMRNRSCAPLMIPWHKALPYDSILSVGVDITRSWEIDAEKISKNATEINTADDYYGHCDYMLDSNVPCVTTHDDNFRIRDTSKRIQQVVVSFDLGWMLPFTQETLPVTESTGKNMKKTDGAKTTSGGVKIRSCFGCAHYKFTHDQLKAQHSNDWKHICPMGLVDSDPQVIERSVLKYVAAMEDAIYLEINDMTTDLHTYARVIEDILKQGNSQDISLEFIQSQTYWGFHQRINRWLLSDSSDFSEGLFGVKPQEPVSQFTQNFRQLELNIKRIKSLFDKHRSFNNDIWERYDSLPLDVKAVLRDAECLSTEAARMHESSAAILKLDDQEIEVDDYDCTDEPNYGSIFDHQVFEAASTFPCARVLSKLIPRTSVFKKVQELQSMDPTSIKDFQRNFKGTYKQQAAISSFFAVAVFSIKRGVCEEDLTSDVLEGTEPDSVSDSDTKPLLIKNPYWARFVEKHKNHKGVFVDKNSDDRFRLVMVDGMPYTVEISVDRMKLGSFFESSSATETRIDLQAMAEMKYFTATKYPLCPYYQRKENEKKSHSTKRVDKIA